MRGIRSFLLQRLWYVHPVLVFTVPLPPAACLRAVMEATRPNQNLLHLRNLFTDGRRYYVDPLPVGFRLTTNSALPWGKGVRSALAASLVGELSPHGEGTRLCLRVRMRWFYFFDIFPIPLFLSAILVFAPWSRLFITLFIIALFTLSWTFHRLTASLQATDMVFFVQKALEEFAPGEVTGLGVGSPEVVTLDEEFRREWERYYEERRRE
jgi:hypothetical protein